MQARKNWLQVTGLRVLLCAPPPLRGSSRKKLCTWQLLMPRRKILSYPCLSFKTFPRVTRFLYAYSPLLLRTSLDNNDSPVELYASREHESVSLRTIQTIFLSSRDIIDFLESRKGKKKIKVSYYHPSRARKRRWRRIFLSSTKNSISLGEEESPRRIHRRDDGRGKLVGRRWEDSIETRFFLSISGNESPRSPFRFAISDRGEIVGKNKKCTV